MIFIKILSREIPRSASGGGHAYSRHSRLPLVVTDDRRLRMRNAAPIASTSRRARVQSGELSLYQKWTLPSMLVVKCRRLIWEFRSGALGLDSVFTFILWSVHDPYRFDQHRFVVALPIGSGMSSRSWPHLAAVPAGKVSRRLHRHGGSKI